MAHPFDITSPSPDTQHTAHFAYSGEVRFGPPYFSLSVDAHSFGQHADVDLLLWRARQPLVTRPFNDYAAVASTFGGSLSIALRFGLRR